MVSPKTKKTGRKEEEQEKRRRRRRGREKEETKPGTLPADVLELLKKVGMTTHSVHQ